MTIFSRSTLFIFSLLLSMGLVSCEKGDMLSPDHSAEMPRSTDKTSGGGPRITLPDDGLILVGNSLDRYGHWQLSYDSHGDLEKLQSISDPSLFRTYSRASNGSGMTIWDNDNGKLSAKTLILFDAKGRCKESFVNLYGFQNGKATLTSYRYIYTYNSSNQLKLIQDQDDNTKYQAFNYVNGNLSTVEFYDHGKKGVFTYQYVKPYGPRGQVPIPDKNGMNLLAESLYHQMDEFLPIYGKFTNSLPVLGEYTNSLTQVILDRYEYNYKFNSSGLIAERVNIRHTFPENGMGTGGQTLTDTFIFGYK